MATHANDDWRYERAGYEHRPVVAYAGPSPRTAEAGIHWTAWERRIATLILAGGLYSGFRVAVMQQHSLATIWQTPGIVESCGISALLWLHAWWRSTVRLK